MTTIKLTVAQALVKFLNQQYISLDGKEEKFVQGVFTIFGHGNVMGLGQALEEDPGDLVVHQGRNEQGMAQAAVAFAKQSHRRRIYACTSSVGPGAANMVTAAATASANSIPTLFLPGDVFATRQPDPVLQQIEQPHDLSISTNDAFKPVSKYWDRINRPEQLMSAMVNAMRVLTDPADTGAVTICLPQDVQAEAYDFPEYFFEKMVHSLDRVKPSDEALNKAVELIKSKKKPIIVCGGGVRYSEAASTLKAFCEKFKIPFGETQAGKSALPYDEVYNLGGIGVTGNSAANAIAKDADLVIALGTRLTDFTTASKSLFAGAEILTINVSKFDAYKMGATRLVGDAKATLEALSDKLSGYESSYTDDIKKAKEAWKEELERLFSVTYTEDFTAEVAGHLDHVLEEFYEQTKSCLTQTKALGILDKYLDDDAIVVGASGSLPGCLQRVWRPKKANTYNMEYGYSCMGYEVSGALGVKLAAPNQEVYAMVGDGSFMMLHSELVTSIQERQKINIVLFDNMAFGCINNLQMSNGMGSFGTEFRYREEDGLTGGLVPIDFAKVAEGYGCKTYSVASEEEFYAAIEDSKKQTVSTLIDVKVLPKTMTNGYGAWWHVGVPEVSKKASIEKSHVDMINELKKARKY
ncbi:3D-(3,5/4)-trihydroxycyclohexane-1,2-dione acylhydrolase (decyclizing) [Acidaminobacter sp. JC074]|uniref:3D-(3,5/4)-trihydroxycyclohexane-1,2-dione acylhydrolase (decyclizing) n=1 Tax=Acidaminobacter sp. JC074 TaxID=2530199 RepID=UPI001F0F787C|nr:3D-(3,5/4)-trihydroxycyclohexane-1,2-dione acylhydrolase (decyclizing) [Acidaminobacter sp. JC074]MCH4889821.1 3D-(3,5/4)-trihydroxycyclohexane-1,2-dione acylhydrolase (decyclizing) [Acidaminobacter sp. JC074]